MSMNLRLPPRMRASLFCGSCPSTLTGPQQLTGRTRTRRTKPDFSLTWLYPSTPTPQSKPQKSLPNIKTWKSRLSECGGSKQEQSRWLWEPLAPSRRTWKATMNSFLGGFLCIKQKPSLPPKVHGLDSDLDRGNQSQLHQYILYSNNNINSNNNIYVCL